MKNFWGGKTKKSLINAWVILVFPILCSRQWMGLVVIYIFTILLVSNHIWGYIWSSSPAGMIMYMATTSLKIYLATMLWGDTRILSAALRDRIRRSKSQRSSYIQIGNCTLPWSTYYLCSIYHGWLVETFLLTRKRLISMIDMRIRWEYPTRTRGVDFRRMISVNEDILRFSWVIKLYQRNKYQWDFYLYILVYLVISNSFAINVMGFNSIISTWAQNLRTFPTPTIIVLKCRESVERTVEEYWWMYCKPSCMITKQYIEYGKYIYIIYSTHICHHQIIVFLFTFLLCRGTVKAAVPDSVPELFCLVDAAVYDKKPVHFLLMCCSAIKWVWKNGKCMIPKHK